MICENCELPAAPHNVTDCFQELLRKKKIADEMFSAAIKLVHHLDDSLEIQNKKLQSMVINLDLATWHYAM
jgi:hypothetical protein